MAGWVSTPYSGKIFSVGTLHSYTLQRPESTPSCSSFVGYLGGWAAKGTCVIHIIAVYKTKRRTFSNSAGDMFRALRAELAPVDFIVKF